MKVRKIIFDFETGETRDVEEEVSPQPEPAVSNPIKISLEDLQKLINYAKAQKWI